MESGSVSSPISVALIEDSAEFRTVVRHTLKEDRYRLHVATTGREGIELVRQNSIDVIILDLSLPDVDGLDVCREIRAFSNAYIIMLTGRVDEVDRVIGLRLGADDYVTKPFSSPELVARIDAVMRRPRSAPQPGDNDNDHRVLGEVVVDVPGREARIDGELIKLTKIEFDLLEAFTSAPKVVFTRDLLLERVWGPNWYGDDHVIDVHIANLRRKIDPPTGSSRIKTVRGVGYRWG
ncbi:MAG: response regulator transcription factor [Actinobacteria bacterium]|nr:response regulator transcription factor [Actinomycetota bacterium]MCB9389782.1 response regulator transcription factor [Acidimicrobiia bacterium]